MGAGVEKVLLEVSGKSMLGRVIEVLKQSPSVDRIVVATSNNTPATTLEVQKLGVESIVTSGSGFEEDMRFVIRKLSLGDVLVVSADLPFITVDILEQAVQKYRSSSKPTLAVMTNSEAYEKRGFKPQYVFKVNGHDLTAVGINIIDGDRIDEGELDQTVFIIEPSDAVLNVNTRRELELARKRPQKEALHNDRE
jgi:GTP:adenosylcobinamide-phosphate guanylyltransferase